MAVAGSAVPFSAPFRPPAPRPRTKPLSAVGMIYQLWRNPLQIWSKAHFEHPVLIGRTVLGLRAVVSDPAGVRRVLLDNSANYRKDALQLRVLRPGLGTGLLTVDGEGWRAQRRALSPPISRPRCTASPAPWSSGWGPDGTVDRSRHPRRWGARRWKCWSGRCSARG